MLQIFILTDGIFESYSLKIFFPDNPFNYNFSCRWTWKSDIRCKWIIFVQYVFFNHVVVRLLEDMKKHRQNSLVKHWIYVFFGLGSGYPVMT